jgi:hypothetical protein
MHNEHDCILLMDIWMHRDTMTRSWGPLSCHSSTAITSCFSMIMHSPMSQSVDNSWKLKMSQFFHGMHTHQTRRPLSMFGMLWIDVYDSMFPFRCIGNVTTYHRPQSTAWSTLCKGDASCCMRQMVITPYMDWFSDPWPYFSLKVSVTDRYISVFPVMWNP